ncbi:hypothetical protein [Moraxella lacunata]
MKLYFLLMLIYQMLFKITSHKYHQNHPKPTLPTMPTLLHHSC